MKKLFYLLACTILACTALFISCSEDKEAAPADVTTKSLPVVTERAKSEVPRDRLIYNTLGDAPNLSLNELLDLYKKDISTAEPDYSTNLKNMWFTVLKNRLYDEGTEEQKLFYINESVALENNLAHFTGFYNLLTASKLLDRAEKEAISNSYYEKNLKAIADVQWPDPKDGEKKKMDLVYAKRTFENRVNFQK